MSNRRRFILGTLAAGGALVLGWTALPPRQRQQPATPLPTAAGEHAFNGWVRVGEDDRVTVMLARSEMGQGVSTSLALLLADELDADWNRVQVQPSPIDGIYNNLATVVDGLPFHPEAAGVLVDAARWLTAKTMREIGVMMTGGSSSVKDLWLPLREAGASARQMLVAAAAAQWGVDAAACSTENGEVTAADIEAIYGLLKMGPTSANMQPARIVWVKSDAAKARLVAAIARHRGNGGGIDNITPLQRLRHIVEHHAVQRPHAAADFPHQHIGQDGQRSA